MAISNGKDIEITSKRKLRNKEINCSHELRFVFSSRNIYILHFFASTKAARQCILNRWSDNDRSIDRSCFILTAKRLHAILKAIAFYSSIFEEWKIGWKIKTQPNTIAISKTIYIYSDNISNHNLILVCVCSEAKLAVRLTNSFFFLCFVDFISHLCVMVIGNGQISVIHIYALGLFCNLLAIESFNSIPTRPTSNADFNLHFSRFFFLISQYDNRLCNACIAYLHICNKNERCVHTYRTLSLSVSLYVWSDFEPTQNVRNALFLFAFFSLLFLSFWLSMCCVGDFLSFSVHNFAAESLFAQ